MKNFIKTLKNRDKKIVKFFEGQKLAKLEKVFAELEEEHQAIKSNLKDVNYLLDLIEKHKIDATKPSSKKNNKKTRNTWLGKIEKTIEKFHLSSTKDLSPEDIAFLKKEKGKLLFEKEQLEKEHHHIHHLLAKTGIYIMDTRNSISREITKGYDIAEVGEKLLEHFGKEIKDAIDYESGRSKIIKMLGKTFAINKIKAKLLFDLLEKSKVISFNVDYSGIISISDYNEFDQFINTNYIPVTGNWIINA